VKKVKKKERKVYDPLALKNLVGDASGAYSNAFGRPLTAEEKTALRRQVLNNVDPALEQAFVVLEKAMSGLPLLIAQHALAQFQFLLSPVIEEEAPRALAGAAASDPQDSGVV